MNLQFFVLGEKHFAGTDIFVPAGNLERTMVFRIAACDLNIELVPRLDNLSEFDPAETRHAPVVSPLSGNNIDHHF
jgi:hypothetical protein